MNLIITILILLSFSYLFTSLAKKIKFPNTVALIIAGLVIGFPFIKNIVLGSNAQYIFDLGDIGLLSLMFLAGLESSWRVLYSERKDALLIAIFAALTPFLLGFVIFRLMGYSLLISFVVGIAMSITAEATKARVLLEIRKLRTKVGAAMMGAGILDDIFGLFAFILVTYLLKEVFLREDILIAFAIVFFFIGILVQEFVGRNYPIIKYIEKGLLLFVVPFFFISIGIHFDFSSLIINPYLTMIIIAIAVTGKLVGTFLIKPFTSLSWKQLHLIGWGMNSRGAVELALVLIAFRTGLIPGELYSSLIVMALFTTMIFPFIIGRMIKNDPKLMD